jgi:hypothetical protein
MTAIASQPQTGPGRPGPAPIRVVEFDLEGPPPALDSDGRYAAAWLVGRRAGIPQGIVEVDLSAGGAPIQEQIAPLAARVSAPTVPGWASVPDAELPRISVVVPTIVARTEELARCLAGFDRLDYPDMEIVLVDNRRALPADDPLPGLIAAHRAVRVARATRPGISAARNAGLAAATGEVIVFTDDDVRVDPQWLRALGRRFAVSPELDAVTGLILPEELETPAQIWFERYYGGFSGERTYAPLSLEAGSGAAGRARVVARDVAGRELRRCEHGLPPFGAAPARRLRPGARDRDASPWWRRLGHPDRRVVDRRPDRLRAGGRGPPSASARRRRTASPAPG